MGFQFPKSLTNKWKAQIYTKNHVSNCHPWGVGERLGSSTKKFIARNYMKYPDLH